MPGQDEQRETLSPPRAADQQSAADQPRAADHPRAADRPGPGSREALRARLERLPPGHPSSPYHVDGESKPAPPRLRHLELAPPAPQRPAGQDQRSELADSDPAADFETAAFPAVDAPAAALSRDQLRVAEDIYDRFSAMEGRKLFGGYGDSAMTTVIRDMEAQLEHGRLAPGAEERALLDRDRFLARFAELIASHPDRTSEQLARRVPGALSYSFVFDTAHYSEGIWQVQDLLQERGFLLEARRNSWGDQENRRVSTMWLDPVRGLPFQVQFHTSASIEAQHLTRSSADLLEDPRIPSAEAQSLRSDLAAAWAAVPVPPGSAAIENYSRTTRR